jgi:hypothetical protein
MKLGCLYARRYTEDPKIFYCPSNRQAGYQYKSYVRPSGSNTSSSWGTLEQAYNTETGSNQWVRVGYSYYPIDETLKTPPIGMELVHGVYVPRYSARRYALLSRNHPYATDGLWDKEDISHKSGIDGDGQLLNPGINALFKDGHVRFVRDEPVTYQGNQVTIFTNTTWNVPIGGSEKPGDVDFRYRFFPIYSMIKP